MLFQTKIISEMCQKTSFLDLISTLMQISISSAVLIKRSEGILFRKGVYEKEYALQHYLRNREYTEDL